MSETIIERLERSYKESPDTTVSVYPGDVVDIISELRAELAAANARAEQAQAELARVRQALQKIDAVALNLAQELNDTLDGKLLTTVSIGVIRVITTATLAAPEQTK